MLFKILGILAFFLTGIANAATCDSSEELVQFYMGERTPHPPIVVAEALGFPFNPSSLRFGKPRRETQFRLEVCLNLTTQKTRLAQILYKGREKLTPATSAQWSVEGLDEGVFGETEKLRIFATRTDVEARPGREHALIIRGHASGVMISELFRQTGEKEWVLSNDFRISEGTLEVGNPFNGACEPHERKLSKRIQMGSASLKFEGCGFLGGGRSMGYAITSVEIRDKGKTKKLEGADLENRLNYEWNHHNECDEFDLTMPEWGAKYRAMMWPGVRVRECRLPNGYFVDYGSGEVKVTEKREHFLIF